MDHLACVFFFSLYFAFIFWKCAQFWERSQSDQWYNVALLTYLSGNQRRRTATTAAAAAAAATATTAAAEGKHVYPRIRAAVSIINTAEMKQLYFGSARACSRDRHCDWIQSDQIEIRMTGRTPLNQSQFPRRLSSRLSSQICNRFRCLHASFLKADLLLVAVPVAVGSRRLVAYVTEEYNGMLLAAIEWITFELAGHTFIFEPIYIWQFK